MIAWVLALALAVQEKSGLAESFSLENGLAVRVRPITGAKTAAVLVLFDIGGDHDPEGRSGLAHLVEHLYVTSAAGDGKARTVEEVFKKYPDGHNAQTGERYTLVCSVVPAGSLEDELADAAARLGDLRIQAGDLDRERPRVLAEVENMFGRIPELGVRNRAGEQIRPTPRGGRRGGRPDHVAAITLDDVRDHWKRYYKPRNAILVVSGACDPKKTREWIVKRFTALPAGAPPPEPGAPGASPAAAVEAVQARPLAPETPSYAGVAYAVPAPGSDLYAPFLVLTIRLQSQASKLGAEPGRFPVMFAPLDDPSKLTATVPLKGGETAGQAVERLDAFVAQAVGPGLKGGEGQRVLQSFGFLLGLIDLPEAALAQNPYGVALILGRSRQLGVDPAKLKERIQGLKEEDLRRAAKEIFAPGRRGAAVVTVKD